MTPRAMRVLTPPTIALCPRCRVHVLHGGWCYHCSFRGSGVVYERKEATDASTGE